MGISKKKYKVPRVFRKLFKLTKHEKWPTDNQLDEKVERAVYIIKHEWPEIKYIFWRKIFRFFKYGIWKFLLRSIIVLGILTLIGWCSVTIYNAKIRIEYKNIVSKDTIYVPDSLKTMERFIGDIGKHESGHTGYLTNTGNGMYGKYQFCESTLKGIGINVPMQTFLDTPELQDAAIKIYMRINKNAYYNDIAKYSGRKIAGILVTESGIIAACQLSPSGMQDWLHSNGTIDYTDKNGCKISSIIKKFGGYQIEL